MPNVGYIKHTEANARRMSVSALQLLNTVDDLRKIAKLRSQGIVDFSTIDYANSNEFGAYSESDFNKAVDSIETLINNGSFDQIERLVKLY